MALLQHVYLFVIRSAFGHRIIPFLRRSIRRFLQYHDRRIYDLLPCQGCIWIIRRFPLGLHSGYSPSLMNVKMRVIGQ